MARRGRKKGGPRYKRVVLSLPKRLYYVLNGIAMGDERKLNRLIKGILEDKLMESTVGELELYLGRAEEEEEKEAIQEEEHPQA
ncbi:MAG: hypothetical protein NZ527_00520 [Hydrogenobacter thermophilus]|uniref:Uncharacterized protein n=1 Tax=Hydrogenobacter thermophilus (strain DSM 6534 / IAM 12695 / TK-6) TaxID=608538 RepID=D3DJH6_HYDTT|nr:hypothetical protein [Hydrogenobacter thermophilus]ADO45901.1 hypothetical protein Hydth_1517 [Hydrogenobacter thermophilus TK-6]MCS7284178.1 hypothetical protein [Hydrogenobacter thermophilus]BAI69978.1 hypothetical protein HTH_1529 [Hydrogenobacter thermophilus TK-6]